MPRSYWSAPVPPPNAVDGTANTTAAVATISPGAEVINSAKTLYPGMLEVGTVVRLRARGEMTQGTTANSITLGFYYGGVAGAAIAAGAGLAVVASLTAVPWWMEYEGEIRALGSSGSIKGVGILHVPGASPGLASDMPTFPIPQTAAARTVTIDTTAAKVVTVGGAFSAVTGGVSVVCYGMSLELL
jgi:hypothetical protein